MERKYQVVRCPKCGGLYLTAHYLASKEERKKAEGRMHHSILALVEYMVHPQIAQGTIYWECNFCGYEFPDIQNEERSV